MSEKETGGPAFPQPDLVEDGHVVSQGQTGMTLRDHFAGLAMQALIAVTPGGDLPHRMAAADAYRYADAMLEARK